MTPLKNDMYDLCFSKITIFQVPWKKTWAVVLHQTKCTKNKTVTIVSSNDFLKPLGFAWAFKQNIHVVFAVPTSADPI